MTASPDAVPDAIQEINSGVAPRLDVWFCRSRDRRFGSVEDPKLATHAACGTSDRLSETLDDGPFKDSFF